MPSELAEVCSYSETSTVVNESIAATMEPGASLHISGSVNEIQYRYTAVKWIILDGQEVQVGEIEGFVTNPSNYEININ